MILQGHVALELPGAFVTAHRAQLTTSGEAAGAAQLEQDIHIYLTQGGVLSADHGWIDSERRRAEFCGCLPLHRVCFRSRMGSDPLSISCDRLEVLLSNSSTDNPKWERLCARGNVEIQTVGGVHAAEEVVLQDWDSSNLPPPLAVHYANRPHPSQLISMTGGVRLTHRDVGNFQSNGPLYIARMENDQKTEIDYILCEEKAVIWTSHPHREVGCVHCPHRLIVDGQNRTATFYGSGDQQVQYDSLMGSARCDVLTIDYDHPQGATPNPKWVSLDQNVRLQFSGEQGLQPRFALADRALYHLEDETLLLTAEEGHRVVMMEGELSRVSAEALSVDCRSREVRGIGHVRLNLDQAEIATLKEAFAHHEFH